MKQGRPPKRETPEQMQTLTAEQAAGAIGLIGFTFASFMSFLAGDYLSAGLQLVAATFWIPILFDKNA